MVHKNYKWNISKERGKKILHETITGILSGSLNLTSEYDELFFALNHRTKDIVIKNNNKSKSISNFVKNVYGGLIYYIENEDDFIIYNDNEKVYIRLSYNPRDGYSEWIFVDDDSY